MSSGTLSVGRAEGDLLQPIGPGKLTGFASDVSGLCAALPETWGEDGGPFDEAASISLGPTAVVGGDDEFPLFVGCLLGDDDDVPFTGLMRIFVPAPRPRRAQDRMRFEEARTAVLEL